MIVYSADRIQFIEDVRSNRIHLIIRDELERKLYRRVGMSEVNSWMNSLSRMALLVSDDELPKDAGVYIEYSIPLTNKRVDFILAGQDEAGVEQAVLVELKQWSSVKATAKDAIVRTALGGSEAETNHPSYQAWTYAALIRDFCETARDDGIGIQPCAFLHNLEFRDAIEAPIYREYIEKAPVFIAEDAAKLGAFLKKYVRRGDQRKCMYRIEQGKIRPSRSLADAVASMIRGNPEFLMIDDQKVVYEAALEAAARGEAGRKQVLIVEGGPGTGKSVVAVNLLVELTRREKLAQYVSKNAAPRAVYADRLAGTMPLAQINNLFRGSGAYTNTEMNLFDALIVDEAHRLNEKSGLYGNLGVHQVKEVIDASKATVFFIDEDQRIHWKDIGDKETIKKWAGKAGAEVLELKLESQFRCGGSDGYLAWVDGLLQIRETANTALDKDPVEFKVFDDPNSLREEIITRNRERNRARMVAGYCWDWKSKRDPSAKDIVIPEYGFDAQWNLADDGSLWIISPTSVNEIGCIHTCQGLEVDYIGVIIGPDLIVRNGKVVAVPEARSSMDHTLRGYQAMRARDPEGAYRRAEVIIKNTYRTLMTRGMKGCFVWSGDRETNSYLRARASLPPG